MAAERVGSAVGQMVPPACPQTLGGEASLCTGSVSADHKNLPMLASPGTRGGGGDRDPRPRVGLARRRLVPPACVGLAAAPRNRA